MRILFLSQLLPYPLDSGVKIRTYYMLRRLCASHDVALVCFVRSDNTPDQEDHLRQYCDAVHTVLMTRSDIANARFLAQSLLRGESYILLRDTVPAMHELIASLVSDAVASGRPFDAAHCDQLWMSQFALAADVPKRVIDQHNAVYLIPKRLAARERNPVKRVVLEREWRVLAGKEAEICRRFDQVIHVTEEDRTALEQITVGQSAPSTVIPICVDAQATSLLHEGGPGNGLLHLGTMYWPPNVEGVLWFAREVFPRIRDRAPGTRLTIVGKRPPRPVARLGSDSAIDVTGYVADAAPYVRNSRVFLVPLLSGGGMRVKILDAWMWGIPVVSTSIGAEGIDVHPEEDILIADGAPQFADAVLRLLNDEGLCQLLSSSGRAWVEERYDWRGAYGALDHIYEAL